MKARKVLLVGDAILDVYTYGDIVSQALYAPVPELEERKSVVSWGGNGLVASNMLELGGQVSFITVVGTDEGAKHYGAWKHTNLKKLFVVDSTRKTTLKERWFAKGKALLQANQVSNHDLSPLIEKKVIRLIEANIPKIDAVVVMDPQHGMLTKRVIGALLRLTKKYRTPFYVNAQMSHRPSNHHLYKGADTMLLNQKEAKAVYPQFTEKKPEQSLRAIQKKLALTNVVITLGAKGSAALWGDAYIRTPPYKVRAVDPCGAGDALLAALALGDRAKPEEALRIANTWAALSTTVHGTIPPKKKDLMYELKRKDHSTRRPRQSLRKT